MPDEALAHAPWRNQPPDPKQWGSSDQQLFFHCSHCNAWLPTSLQQVESASR
jgi:hypothetical protein